MANFMIGTAIKLIATFKDSDGALANPATVTFKVLDPDGNVDSYVYGTDEELAQDSTGIYSLTLEPDAAGPFYWRVEGTGAVSVAAEDTFEVDAGVFPAV
jgi:hypothetical protein